MVIKKDLEYIIDKKIVCGLSCAFIEKSNIEKIYLGKKGVVSPWKDYDVDENSIYDLASLSKVVATTTRILQLIDNNIIDFSTCIDDILKLGILKDVSIEDLLLHSSGLPAEIIDKNQITKYNIIEKIKQTKQIGVCGEKFCYSDVGFILLGLIIKKIDGMNLAESFEKNIFSKFDMLDTSYNPNSKDINILPQEYSENRGWICGEVHDSKTWLLGESGSAGVFSTLNDLIKFVKLYLERDEILFSKNIFDKIITKNKFNRTYGWSIEYGLGTLYHIGFTGTSMLIDMNNNRAFILLTNRIHPNRNNQEFLDYRIELNKKWLNS